MLSELVTPYYHLDGQEKWNHGLRNQEFPYSQVLSNNQYHGAESTRFLVTTLILLGSIPINRLGYKRCKGRPRLGLNSDIKKDLKMPEPITGNRKTDHRVI